LIGEGHVAAEDDLGALADRLGVAAAAVGAPDQDAVEEAMHEPSLLLHA
jgi:hypothetical protein